MDFIDSRFRLLPGVGRAYVRGRFFFFLYISSKLYFISFNIPAVYFSRETLLLFYFISLPPYPTRYSVKIILNFRDPFFPIPRLFYYYFFFITKFNSHDEIRYVEHFDIECLNRNFYTDVKSVYCLVRKIH